MAEIWSEKVIKMFIKDEAEIASRVSSVESGVVYLVKLLFQSNE